MVSGSISSPNSLWGLSSTRSPEGADLEGGLVPVKGRARRGAVNRAARDHDHKPARELRQQLRVLGGFPLIGAGHVPVNMHVASADGTDP